MGHNCVIIDDPFSEKDIISGNTDIFHDAFTWFQSGPLQRLAPDGAAVVIHCVAEGERVLLADGIWKPIEAIVVGDIVASKDGLNPVGARVSAVIPQGEDDIIEVVSRSCALRVNKKHPFLVVKGGLKKSARTQDECVLSREWNTEWVEAGDLVPGDTVVTIKESEARWFTAEYIESITAVGRAPVYDLTVEGTENFIAEGFVVHNTRWSKIDLIGQLINQMAKNPGAEQWEVIEFPAIINAGTDNEKSLWPERWPLEELLKKKAVMAPFLWNAQYMQSPTGEEGALLKAEWWKHWDDEDPPDCEYTIMSLDAAQETNNRSDYNAVVHIGVFYKDNAKGESEANVIVLDAWKKRMEFPELKKAMIEEYNRWEPDSFIVEKKSNGAALYQELRSMGMAVTEFTPGKGQDKIARVNAVSDMLSSGMVWIPTDRGWAKELISECSEFPAGAHDDLVDSLTQALMRVRRGGFIRLPSDAPDDDLPEYRRTINRGYY